MYVMLYLSLYFSLVVNMSKSQY